MLTYFPGQLNEKGLRMRTQDAALLEQAKQQGYLVKPLKHDRTLLAHYLDWCCSQKIPLICVTLYGKSASLETNMESVILGYLVDDGPTIDLHAGFAPTPELEARCQALADRCRESVLPHNKKRAGAAFNQEMGVRYIRQETAIEVAQELWAIWQEAKQYLP